MDNIEKQRKTSIWISIDLAEYIKSKGKFGETYEEILRRLLS